ncbi:MAG: HD-GYP domain-containing protein [Treponema sp.]|jgi:HD-GYP domain-containing protein (c-di-GMP phosphodiesterase class II)|nr:HD-GYP domain-containing protein [Treponema sp.]
MKTIEINTLHPGMIFSAPVYIEGNNLLVPEGVAIRKKDIDRLISWGYHTVSTEGDVVTAAAAAEEEVLELIPLDESSGDTGSESAKKQNSGSVPSLAEVQENKGAYRSYVDLIDRLDSVFFSISTGISVEPWTVNNMVTKLLQTVRDERNSIIGFILGGEVSGHMMAKSSVNTAILSALIAMELKLAHHKIMQIVTGALLHDVGMLKLPREIIEKSGGLSEAELQRIQAHPLHAYKIITRELMYPEDVGIIALQHHERWNGEGYPQRISGVSIDMGARIVSVADAFEAMVSEKPYRNSMIGYQAMKNLLADNSRRFDPDVLKAFIKTMGIYPIGSIILLNNGSIARVMEVQKEAPLRPRIRVLIDECGKMYRPDEGEIIDLLTEKSIFISQALDPKEISKKRD